MAYADLGGLGSKQGAPVVYDWAPPSALPHVLPWLAILALLMLKPNRCASAWWVLVPLACVAALAAAPDSALKVLPSSPFDIFLEVTDAVGFGLAAVWLLSGYLAWQHRALAFLGVLLALGCFSLLAFAIKQGWEGLGIETLQVGMALALSVFVITLALTLAGVACRRRYGCVRLSLWLLVALMVVWLVVIAPFFLIAMIAAGGSSAVREVLAVVPMIGGLTFAVMLPFLVVSYANRFYRERLKALLHLGGAAPPPVISQVPLAMASASRH